MLRNNHCYHCSWFPSGLFKCIYDLQKSLSCYTSVYSFIIWCLLFDRASWNFFNDFNRYIIFLPRDVLWITPWWKASYTNSSVHLWWFLLAGVLEMAFMCWRFSVVWRCLLLPATECGIIPIPPVRETSLVKSVSSSNGQSRAIMSNRQSVCDERGKACAWLPCA